MLTVSLRRAVALVSVLLVVTAKLRYGGDKVDRSLYELVAALDGSQAPAAPERQPGPPRSAPGLPPRPPLPPAPPKRGSHVE